MSSTAPVSPARKLWDGSLRGFLTESIALPAGILSAAVLSRDLGPSGYGLIALTVAIVSWIEWGITSSFARATIKLIGEQKEWGALGGHFVRIQLALSLAAAAILFALSPAVAAALRQPELTSLLRLLAVDIPLFCLAGSHRYILIGRGLYHEKAVLSAVRHVSRVALIVLFIYLGMGLNGVMIALIGSSFFEFAVARCYIRPPFFQKFSGTVPGLWHTTGWLFLFATSMRLFERIDLLALKMLGAGTADVGYYGAAQNLCHIPVSLAAISFSPLLLSSLTRAFQQKDAAAAKSLIVPSLRSILLLLPMAAAVAVCSGWITRFVYGETFAPAAEITAVLIFSSVAIMYGAICTSILTAMGKVKLTFFIAGGMILADIACLWLFIPVWGMIGAAAATTLTAVVGAAVALFCVLREGFVAPAARP